MNNFIRIIDVNNYNKISQKTFEEIKRHKIIIFRNLFTKDEILREVAKFKKKKFKITKKSGEYFIGKKNFSRKDFKNKNNIKHARYQYFHVLFEWNKDESFRKIFSRLIKFRNKIYRIKSNKILFYYNKFKYFNLPKVHFYPKNGHLGAHKDFSEKQDKNFIIVTSERGVDFDKGGYFIKINKKIIDIEKFLKVGDVMCNDLDTIHGVKKILCKKNQTGRYSLVLSMRKVSNKVND